MGFSRNRLRFLTPYDLSPQIFFLSHQLILDEQIDIIAPALFGAVTSQQGFRL